MTRLAADVKQVRLTPGQTHIRLARLAGTVHHAADDGNVEVLYDVFQALLQSVHHLDHVEILARAGGAGDDVDALAADVQAFQDIEADLHLLHRIGSQRYPDGVADACGEEHAEADRGFHAAGAQPPRLGDTEVQRLFNLPGKQLVRFHRHEYFRCLEANLEIAKVQALQDLDVTQGGFHQGLGRGLAVFFLQILLQRTGIDADANRNAMVLGRLNHCLHPVLTPDIAGIDAQAIRAKLGDAQGDLVVEMDVGDERHRRALPDLAEGFRRLHAGH